MGGLATSRGVGVAALAVAVALVGGPMEGVAAQSSGLEFRGTTTYRLEPKSGAVAVRVEAELVNTLPSRRRGAYIETPYLGSFAIPVIGPVRNARARSSVGGDLSVSVDDIEAGLRALEVDLSPNLVYGQPQSVTVDFELPGQPNRSPSVTRVNRGFANWFAVAVGDPGASEVVIDIPESFELTLSPAHEPPMSRRGGRRVFRLDDISDVEDGVVFVTARNEDALDATRVPVGDREIEVKAWPNDPQWAASVTDTVERGVPVLSRLIGQPLPDRDLTVVESTSGYHLGYAGAYDTSTGVIEVGDLLEQQVVLHELAHIWINANTFTERWVFEGLAEELASHAARELDVDHEEPRTIDVDDPGRVKLNAWSQVSISDERWPKIEQFAYNASHKVVHDLVDEVGLDGLRAVLSAASARSIAYRGDPEPEDTPVRDWRYFYDLMDIVADSDNVAQLFRRHVLNERQQARLDQRAIAGVRFDELDAAGAGWTAPRAVREEMAKWEFSVAQLDMDRSQDVLERARTILTELDGAGVDAAPRLETEYETARDLDDLEDRIGEFERVGQALVDEHRRRSGVDPVTWVGLVGSDELDRARDAYQEGDLEAASSAIEVAATATDAATGRGAALVATGVVLGLAATIADRRRRHTTPSRTREPKMSPMTDNHAPSVRHRTHPLEQMLVDETCPPTRRSRTALAHRRG